MGLNSEQASEGLIIGTIFASEIWGVYFEEGSFFSGGGGLIIEILRYVLLECETHFNNNNY